MRNRIPVFLPLPAVKRECILVAKIQISTFKALQLVMLAESSFRSWCKPYAVLIDIKRTTARPNAVYKDISELFRGFSVYVVESEAECKMVQQKWKRYERATHIMWLRRQAKATIRKHTIALWTVWVYSRLTVGKTITFAKVPACWLASIISEIMKVGSIPIRRIMWNSTK